MAGLNNLFGPNSKWILPMYQPTDIDIVAIAREVNVLSGGFRFNESDLQKLAYHQIAPNYRITHYHGDEVHPLGDPAIGRDYLPQRQARPVASQNMLEYGLWSTMEKVYRTNVDTYTTIKNMFSDIGPVAAKPAWKL